MSRDHAKSAGLIAALIYLAFAVCVGLASIIFVLRHYTKFPFGDHWTWLERFYRDGLLTTLFIQFNEHRLVIPGLFYFLDHRYFGATNTFLVVLLLLMQVACTVLVVLPLWRQEDVSRTVRCVFAGFGAIMMLWFIQAEDFFYPYQICILCCNLGILLTLHLFARFADQARESQPPVWMGTGILAAALWANFSNGHGILVWPILLAAGLLLRLPKRWLWTVLLVALCALGIYFFHYRTPTQHASPWESLRYPIHVTHYVVLMLGLPFFGVGTRDIEFSSHFRSYIASTAGILLAAVLLLRFASSKAAQRSRTQLVYCSLLLICLGTSCITALGRSRFPLQQALSGRYAPIPVLFWLSLAALVTAHLCTWEIRSGILRALWCALLVMASAAALSTQAPQARYMAYRERAQAAAALSITVGVPDRVPIGQELSGKFERIFYVDRNAAPWLGHSMFWRPEAALLGKPLPEHSQLVSADRCLGVVDVANLLPAPANGARMLGWAWDHSQRTEIGGIWVVDGRKIVRGLGITGLSRLDVATAFSDSAMSSAGWVAYSQLPGQATPDALSVLASLDGGKSVCQIGSPRTPVP